MEKGVTAVDASDTNITDGPSLSRCWLRSFHAPYELAWPRNANRRLAPAVAAAPPCAVTHYGKMATPPTHAPASNSAPRTLSGIGSSMYGAQSPGR